jgi:signal transduction histidine kinase
VLGESLEYEQVLKRLATLVVGSIAQWCVVDVVEDNDIRHLAAAHADPTRQSLLAELQRRYPARWDSPHAGAQAMRTAAPIVIDVAGEASGRYFVDDEHRRAAIALGMRTAITAPIVVRGHVLGAITVGSVRPSTGPEPGPGSPSGRDHGLALVEELARRTATAIDNAGLYRQAQEASRLREEFLSVASHELNTPMVSLMLTLQSLVVATSAPQSDPARLHRMADLAERQSQRMKRLISDLLDVTRIERGPLAMRVEDVDLAALTREVLARSRPVLAKAGCEVSLSVAGPGPILGRWDPQRLDQVIVNLISNAAKFGKEKPVEIEVATAGAVARLSVTDHGIGIDPKQHAHIFTRFGRAVSAMHYGGLGLGLYICRRIMDAHSGSIAVRSEPGRGATFVLELPLSSALS